MKTLRVGVIGLGAFGEAHIRTFAGISGVQVVAVASRSLSRAAEIVKVYGIGCFYGSYQELIDDPQIDAVTVCTDESAHIVPTVSALQAGNTSRLRC